MPLSSKVRLIASRQPKSSGPLWTGPCGDGPNGGVTQGQVGRWLSCRERFRVKVMCGVAPAERFNHRLEYGNMWHCCEEALAAGNPKARPWENDLQEFATKLLARHPLDREQVDHWHRVCRAQFAVYVDHWRRHPEVIERTPLFQEQVFDVPCKLPSGRVARLRGKWDAVDLIGKGKGAGVFLAEHKTKGGVDEQAVKRQLSYDLQTMLYLTALKIEDDRHDGRHKLPAPIRGVRYNVVRRPLSGGKGTIVIGKGTNGVKCGKCKGTGRDPKVGIRCIKCGGIGRVGAKPPETRDAYHERVAQYIRDEPDHYFFRWTCHVSAADLQRFRRECLDPILENMCDDYEWWAWCKDAKSLFNGQVRQVRFKQHCPRHYRHPFGITNSIDEYGWSDVDEYLNSGSMTGLRRLVNLFPELQEDGACKC